MMENNHEATEVIIMENDGNVSPRPLRPQSPRTESRRIPFLRFLFVLIVSVFLPNFKEKLEIRSLNLGAEKSIRKL